MAGGPYGVLATLATIAAAAEDDLATGRAVVERVMEVSAGLSAGDRSLAAGANTEGRSESGPVAGALSSADGDQYGCAQIGSRALLHHGAARQSTLPANFPHAGLSKKTQCVPAEGQSSFKCHTRSETKGLRIAAAPRARLATK